MIAAAMLILSQLAPFLLSLVGGAGARLALGGLAAGRAKKVVKAVKIGVGVYRAAGGKILREDPKGKKSNQQGQANSHSPPVVPSPASPSSQQPLFRK